MTPIVAEEKLDVHWRVGLYVTRVHAVCVHNAAEEGAVARDLRYDTKRTAVLTLVFRDVVVVVVVVVLAS